MLRIGDKTLSIMVVFVVLLHTWWAVMISLDNSALNATAVEALYRLISDSTVLAFLLIAVSCMALGGMMVRHAWAFVLLLPQQALLTFSATGALSAIWLSQFADGVVRSRAFISADQFYIVLVAICHTIAIIMHAKSRNYRDG